jgi:pimeloyl-ACP methyl ester carboxylesterase
LTQDLEQADPQAVYRSACSLYRWVREGDLPARLAACPRLARFFLYGEKSRALEEIDAVPGMRSLSIPDSGHFPMHENPDAFYALLASVIAGA